MDSSEKKIVVGVTGLKGAGKDVFTAYLAENYGFVVRSCGDEIRDQLRRDGLEATIENQIQLGNRGRLESGDVGYWAKRVAQSALAAGLHRIAVNGLRHPDEIKALRLVAGPAFLPVGIVAPLAVRAQRLIGRGRGGDPTNMEDFLKLDDTDRGIGQPPHGQQVDRALALVDWENVYDNIGSLEDLHAWTDALIARLTRRT